MITYLDPNTVTDKKQTKTPMNYSRTGYGSKLPSSMMIQVNKRWHRVYYVLWSNIGSAYIVSKGAKLFLGAYEYVLYPGFYCPSRF